MKSFLLSLLILLSLSFSSKAQNWTGAVSSNWDDPNNWSPASVPNTNSVVSITNVGNSPKMQSSVTIGTININTGVVLDFNGYSMTISSNAGGYKVFNGATFNNSNAATDIILSISTGTSGYTASFDGCTINDKITFNLSGDYTFTEGSTANQFNGDVIYNVSSGMPVILSNTASSSYAANFSFSRTVAGTSILVASGGNIGGNFTVQNAAGGIIRIGNAGIPTIVSGTCNINAVYPSSDEFVLHRFKNLINGGLINVQNSRAFDVQDDTLKVSSMTLQGYGPIGYANFLNNKLTGNLTIEDNVNFGSGFHTAINNNHITGNTIVTINGSNTLYEASNANDANTYIGSTVFNLNSGATAYISHADKSDFNGNLSIIRTVAGYTRAFNAGATINGNYTYQNNTSGDNDFGNIANLTSVSGTVNMNVNLSPIGNFNLIHFNNQTAGGKINLYNTRGFNIQNDSLIVDSINVMYYTGSAYSTFANNLITAHVTIADSANYGGGYATNIQNNTINGNSKFRSSSPNAFYEAQGANMQNVFNGNVSMDVSGPASVFVSLDAKSTINGNFTFNRTFGGYTSLFNSGADISGNFSFTKNAYGATNIGNLSNKSSIGGTLNINATQNTNDVFTIHRVQNYTNGGSINLQSIRGMSILQDTLLLTSLSHTGYGGPSYAYLYDNLITGNILIEDDAAYGSGYATYVQNNTINGNTVFNVLGLNNFEEANAVNKSNIYNGNVNVNVNGSGFLYLSRNAPSTYNGDLTINRIGAGHTNAFNSGATVTGNFSYTKSAGGGTSFGNNNFKTSIAGMVNMNVTQTPVEDFNMYWLVNGTNGGSINIDTLRSFNIYNDSLKVSFFNLNNYGNNAYNYFYNSKVEGDVNISNVNTFGGGYHTDVAGNTFTGNTVFTNNSSNIFYDGYGSGNNYLGNVTYNRTGNDFNIGINDTNSYAGNLSVNSINPVTMNLMRFNGNINGTLNQLSSAPLNINYMMINKTGGASLTLNNPVRVVNAASFESGFILSTPASPLIFLNNALTFNASGSSHIIGATLKVGDDAFSFPLGNGTGLHLLGMSAPGSTTDSFLANIVIKNPADDGYPTTSKEGALLQIEPFLYWTLNRLSGTTPTEVTLGWGNACVNEGITDLPSLAVSRWNGSQWTNLGNAGTSGNAMSGTVKQTGTTSNYGLFILGSTSNLNTWSVTTVFGTNSPICAGSSTTLTASGAANYTWEPGGMTGSSITVNPAATTTYTVTGISPGGCLTTATKTITVSPPINLNTAVSSPAICTGGSATITASGALTYTWQPGALSGASINVSPASTTIYTVTGTNGCSVTATAMITVGTCAPCGTNIVINTSPYTILLTESNSYIETNGTVLVDSGAYVKFDAAPTSYILLRPGFFANYGSVFIAQPLNGCTAGSPQLPENKSAAMSDGDDKQGGLFIYPNPTNGKITLTHPEGLKEAVILDLMGKKVRQISLSSAGKSELDLTDLPNGVYILYAQGYTNIKIIKN